MESSIQIIGILIAFLAGCAGVLFGAWLKVLFKRNAEAVDDRLKKLENETIREVNIKLIDDKIRNILEKIVDLVDDYEKLDASCRENDTNIARLQEFQKTTQERLISNDKSMREVQAVNAQIKFICQKIKEIDGKLE